MTKFLWKIGGEAGFGIMTTGISFSQIAVRLGYHVFDYVQYPSLIRGGHNAYEVCVADKEVHSLKWEIDILVCLNKDTYQFHKNRLAPDAYVLYDGEEFELEGEKIKKIKIPLAKILKELNGPQIMKNTIALAGSLAILGEEISVLYQVIEKQFSGKNKEIIDFNKKFAEAGFNYVKENYSDLVKPMIKKITGEEKLILSGNDAFSFGSVIADCRLYAAYPMTPSSSVLTTLADWQNKTNMVVRHAEDEIAVINTAVGASFAGVRSAVGTSGGGFALMVETVSLTGITEIPLVIFLSQRPGPATGMPTWTAQGDLLFAINAGHGEFFKIILAPGDVEEMIELTVKAFNLADIYQTPVIVMSDMFLSESHKSVIKSKVNKLINNYKVNRGKTITAVNGKYLRYKLTDDGISERLIPGAKGSFYQANSYEHLEDGHTTEDGEAAKKQMEKRNKKIITYLSHDYSLPKIYGNPDKSEIIFVAWGSSKGPVIEAINLLKTKGKETSLIHFNHVYPLDREKIIPLFKKNKRYVLVENNYQGQFGKILRQETGIEITEKILKYDGRNFWPEEIIKKLKF